MLAGLLGIGISSGNPFNRPVRTAVGSNETSVDDLIHEVDDRLYRNAFVVSVEHVEVGMIKAKPVVVFLDIRHRTGFVETWTSVGMISFVEKYKLVSLMSRFEPCTKDVAVSPVAMSGIETISSSGDIRIKGLERVSRGDSH